MDASHRLPCLLDHGNFFFINEGERHSVLGIQNQNIARKLSQIKTTTVFNKKQSWAFV